MHIIDQHPPLVPAPHGTKSCVASVPLVTVAQSGHRPLPATSRRRGQVFVLRATALFCGLILMFGAAMALLANEAKAQGPQRSTLGAQRPSNWQVQAGLLSDSNIRRLKQRYPWIHDADGLEDLLRDIGRRQASMRLEAERHGDVWFIKGERSPQITDIDIAMVSRVLRTPLYAATQAFIGQVDSPELRQKVRETASNMLRRKGYPQAQIAVRGRPSESGVDLTLNINAGEPCVIARVEMGFRLPQGVELDLKPGELCDRDDIDEAVAQLDSDLRDRGYNQLKLGITELSLDPDSNTATVYLAGVLGQKVRYEIIDASKALPIQDNDCIDDLVSADPTIIGPDAVLAELAHCYRNEGYLDVQVKGPEVKKNADDAFVYAYTVEPGREYRVRAIRFEGNTAFDDDELMDTMSSERFPIIQRAIDQAPPFNPEEVQNGVGRIRTRYHKAGYWEAQVRDPGAGQRDRESGNVRLAIQIEEGAQHLLQGITIKGALAFPEKDIRNLFPTKDGEALDRSLLLDFQSAIRSLYLSRGYLYTDAKIELQSRQQRRRIYNTVNVSIVEGPRVRIGDISITGLMRTDPKVVRRELSFEPGDWYDPERIAVARTQLTKLGIFRSVQITPEDRNAAVERIAELDLVVDVREAQPGNVSFGPGWSLGRGWNYGAEASYSNIGGVGRQVSVRGAFSEEKQQRAISSKTLLGRRIGAGYLEPWLFDYPIDGIINASQKAEASADLWELSYGGEVALQHTLRYFLPGSTVSVFYGQEVAQTEAPDRIEDQLVANDVRIGQTGIRYRLDQRDNLKFPTSGFYLETETAWANYNLGGDLQYFKWQVAPSFYFQVVDDVVFALGLQIASYENIDRKGNHLGILPPSKRLKAGGTDSVRGYRPDALGPIVREPQVDPSTCAVSGYDTKSLNGNRRTIIETELRYRFDADASTSFFVDNGNTFLTNEQMDRFARAYNAPVIEGCPTIVRSVEDNVAYDYSELLTRPGYLWNRHYWSYGAAFGLLTPLGSLNLAYGLPWREPKSELCRQDQSRCAQRASSADKHWLLRGEVHINVGARF